MKKTILKLLQITLGIYGTVCGLLFFYQEKLIFFPEKLVGNHKFSFDQKFEEITITTKDQKSLNSILFKSDSAKGLIFYLHGNAGSLNSWGKIAKTYTDLHYDVFMLDYRGYGKSGGIISNQEQLHQDAQVAYDEMKSKYDERKIVVLGYSVGTGIASKIASTNKPKLLILQAPYYSMKDLMRHKYPIIPTFILKYQLETNEHLKACKMPVIIFHGDQDKLIYYGSSLKLNDEFKRQDTLITLKGQGHNGITENPEYRAAIRKILTR